VQIGAAIEREFSYEMLACVADRTEVELRKALDRLTNTGLVFRRGVPPEANYMFKHALIQDAAYSTLLRGRRQQLHAAIGRALEERFPDRAEIQPELVAHHLTEAGHAERAVRYWLKAGRRSVERSANREAVRQLQRGLEMLMTLPASTERDRLELEIQLALGTPLIALFSWSGAQVAATYERASILCERLGDAERVIPALFGLASNRLVRGETQAARRLAEQC
jgi:predicted ATPase